MGILTNKLKEEGLLNELLITLGIVGSRKMRNDDDYGSGIWNIFAPNLTIYGFDADEDACNFANDNLKLRQINWIEKHIPLAISNQKGESTLYVTKGVDCSSLYPPNESYLNRFAAFNEHLKLDFTVDIETTTIDDFCRQENVQEIDFLYLDIQGAELNVIQGATELLKRSILGIQLEVEFSPLYQNQPLFSDVDSYLRTQGFALFDLITDHPMCRRPRLNSLGNFAQNRGQLLWADALYFRDPLGENSHPVTQNYHHILKLACLADIFNYSDYSLELFQYLITKYYSQIPPSYINVIQPYL
jgi:FkbM family methyltransferase